MATRDGRTFSVDTATKPETAEAAARAARRSTWPRRLRNGAVTLAVLVAVYALLGFLVLPVLAKPRIEAALTEEFGRQATIGRLEFNPFSLRGRVMDFALADREPGRFLARFAALDLDVSSASLRYRAPVLDAVRLSQPRIELIRNADDTYNIDDLIAKADARPEGPSPLISLNNIEVEDGEVVLDDRPHRRRLVASALGIGIPFLSSLPHDAEIRVTPRFEGTFDGTSFALQANSTSPFADAKEATLVWTLDALPLAMRQSGFLSPRMAVSRSASFAIPPDSVSCGPVPSAVNSPARSSVPLRTSRFRTGA